MNENILAPGLIETIEFDPTLSDTNYAAGDVLFAVTEIANIVPYDGHIAEIMHLGVTWNITSAPSFTLLFFDEEISSFGAINDACAVTFADLKRRIANFDINATDYQTVNSLDYLDITGERIGILKTKQTKKSVWLGGVINDAYTGDLEGDLNIKMEIKRFAI